MIQAIRTVAFGAMLTILQGTGGAFALPAAPVSGVSPIPDDYNCITCHMDMTGGEPLESLDPDMARIVRPVVDWQESVHREVGVLCVDCHGGDPTDMGIAMDPDEGGFKGKPAKADIPALCGKCHGDARLMRKYNQRSDQLSLYTGSIHGIALLKKGDGEAASCTDCHGQHKILRVKDPKSTVNRANVAETCGECHSKKDVFEHRGIKSDQLERYKKSWHYQRFSEGDLLVPTCVDCHSNHAISRAATERTQTVCFKCHAENAEYYKASPHWQAYKRDGEPVCLHCHGAHDILRPETARFTGEGDRDCIACHDTDSDAYKTGVAIAEALKSVNTAVAEATAGLEELESDGHGGFETSSLAEAATKARESVKSIRSLSHKLDAEAVKKDAEPVIAAAQGVSEQVSKFWSEIGVRKTGLVIAWLIFLGLAGALWLWTKAVEKDRDDQK